MWDSFVSFFDNLEVDVLGITLAWPPIVVGTLLGVLLLIFFAFYVFPGLVLDSRLKRVAEKLRSLKAEAAGPIPTEEAGQAFSGKGGLEHLWSEYEETLHPQYKSEDGERSLEAIRATVPAEVFFNPQSVIDTTVNAEFFKHLPGILTGLGIIATFAGLITGLHQFNMSLDPEALNVGLEKLILSVKEAFFASGAAIFVAIFVTLWEKIQLNVCHRRLERLVHAIDSLYDAGAGEEYLSRLVTSAEESATQTRHLKDSLVEDMKVLLTELTERQIAAQQGATSALANEIGQSITQSLETPLNKIAGVVERASGDQGQAVHGMLENLMTAFMAKLDDTLGDQMRGLSAMMQDSAGSMRQMQDGFRQLLDEMSKTSGSASRDMAEQLDRMMSEAEARQRQMAESLNQAVEQMQGMLSSGQADVQAQMQAGVEGLRATLDQMMTEMAEQRRAQAQDGAEEQRQMREAVQALLAETRQAAGDVAGQYSQQLTESLASIEDRLDGMLSKSDERQQAADQRNEALLDELQSHFEEMAEASRLGVDAMRENTQKLEQVSLSAIEGMNRGAEGMRRAAEDFSTAGDSVTGVIDKGASLYEKVMAASQSLEAASHVVREAVAGYNETRNSVEAMAETMRRLTDEAEERGQHSAKIVKDMSELVDDFADAQDEAAEYLEKISGVMSKGFDDFASAVAVNMSKSRGEFDNSLSQAVGMIQSELQELEATLASFRSRVSA